MKKFLVGYMNDYDDTYDVKVIEGEEKEIKALVEKYNDDSYNTEFFYTECAEPLTIDKLKDFLDESGETLDNDDIGYCNLFEDDDDEEVVEEGSPFIEKRRLSPVERFMKLIDITRAVVIALTMIIVISEIVKYVYLKF